MDMSRQTTANIFQHVHSHLYIDTHLVALAKLASDRYTDHVDDHLANS